MLPACAKFLDLVQCFRGDVLLVAGATNEHRDIFNNQKVIAATEGFRDPLYFSGLTADRAACFIHSRYTVMITTRPLIFATTSAAKPSRDVPKYTELTPGQTHSRLPRRPQRSQLLARSGYGELHCLRASGALH